ncbi:MAG TPA: tetratricopeptide repeat protein [Terriglobales bacterium]|nr:tetratricopeptide repeat protein [Terriglobales bacterium]
MLLVMLSIFAVLAYIGTRQFARSNRAIEAHLAAVWYQKGQHALLRRDWSTAVSSFRKATVNDHSNRIYARALADALRRDGRDPEARTLLLELRELSPEDPIINLDLARIEAKENNVAEAVGYYHNALYGIWTGEDVDLQRQAIRRELIRFLIAQSKYDQALAEIVALAAHLPDTVGTQVELGQWFLRAGDATRSAEHFTRALQQQPRKQDALRGAGEAFFKTGDYLSARRALLTVHQRDSSAQAMLDIATRVVSADPLERHLSESERNRRIISDLSAAISGLQACTAKQTTLQQKQTLQSLQPKLDEMRSSLSEKNLKRNPDLVFNTLDLIYETLSAISKSCGDLHGTDLALFLVAQKSRRSEQ